jgi:hypothetical protein
MNATKSREVIWGNRIRQPRPTLSTLANALWRLLVKPIERRHWHGQFGWKAMASNPALADDRAVPQRRVAAIIRVTTTIGTSFVFFRPQRHPSNPT